MYLFIIQVSKSNRICYCFDICFTTWSWGIFPFPLRTIGIYHETVEFPALTAFL